MKWIVFALCLLPAAAFAQGKTTTSNPKGTYTDAEVQRAVEILRSKCQPLGGRYWDDLSEVQIRVVPEFASLREAHGWKTAIHIEVVVPDKPRSIPAFRDDIGVIAGHHLFFFLGGGKKPGFYASKRATKWLCGIPNYDNGDDQFVPVNELGFLNK